MNPNLKKTLRSILIPNIPRIVLIFSLLMISTGFQALAPWPFKILLDNVLGSELIDTSTFVGSLLARFTSISSAGAFVVISYFTISILGSLTDFIYSVWDNISINKITRVFAAACYENLTKLDYSYFRRKSVGTFIYKLNYDVSALGDIIDYSILPIISSGLFLLVTIIILADIDFTMALVSLACLPLLTVSLYFMNKKIDRASTLLERKNGTLYTFVEQVISQLKIIQAYTQQHSTLKKYDQAMWTSLSGENTLVRNTIILTLINGIIIAVTYTVIISLGIQRVANGTLSSGLLIVFIFYMDSIVTPVVDIIGAISDYKKNYVKLKNTADIFDPAHHIKDTGTQTVFRSDDINFEDVTVRDGTGKAILSNISLNAEPGKLTAIVGKSGSGKSSLFLLLLRLSDASEGLVKIGGVSIEGYSVSALRKHISFVPQETDLFDESISEIISFGKENATPKEIGRAAELACATTFIKQRPEGYESKVGERGNLLSGGERQRLLLARAYLRNSPIILMDEIFSAQDVETQGAMMKSLREEIKNKTVLMITHTYSILEPNDHVIVIEAGKKVADGTYKTLQEKHKLPSLEEV